MRLSEAELPRPARVLDRGERRGAGSAVVSRDLDHVGARLGDARGYGADANLPNQLHRHLKKEKEDVLTQQMPDVRTERSWQVRTESIYIYIYIYICIYMP